MSTSLLSETDAMSCWSWSPPAGPGYCAGFQGTVCTQCYAGQGRYRMPNVEHAQQVRWRWWKSAPKSERIRVLKYAIERKTRRGIECKIPGCVASHHYFRVFDSGDFSEPGDVHTWIEVAKALPAVRFWIPTKTWWLPEFLKPLKLLSELPNVVLRASALDVDGKLPDGWRQVSRVISNGPGCPKQSAGNCEAAGCRACWDKNVQQVEYRVHGHKVNWNLKAKSLALRNAVK